MTLEDAVAYYSEIAKECRQNARIESNDYMDMRDATYEAEQLADWLNELIVLRERIEDLISRRAAMDDLISRRAAIEALGEEPLVWHDDDAEVAERNQWRRDVAAIKALLPVQPERRLYANMSDAEFEKWLYEHGICHPNIHEPIPCDVVPLLIDNAISELPSVQPERKKGRWISDLAFYDEDGCPCFVLRCSECGEAHPKTNFCPNCGADMRKGAEECLETK